jgi:hypothetical protein
MCGEHEYLPAEKRLLQFANFERHAPVWACDGFLRPKAAIGRTEKEAANCSI